MLKMIYSSILAGVCISIGCIVNLKVGGYLGPFLFCFGLLTIIHYRFKLFTGVSGFVGSWRDMKEALCLVLPGNIVGCALTAIIVYTTLPEVREAAEAMVSKRNALGVLDALPLSVLCGFIVTAAVQFAREGRYLPLLFGIPLFIFAGFVHCIADGFYYSMGVTNFDFNTLIVWLTSVVGNFIGCNLYRWPVKLD